MCVCCDLPELVENLPTLAVTLSFKAGELADRVPRLPWSLARAVLVSTLECVPVSRYTSDLDVEMMAVSMVEDVESMIIEAAPSVWWCRSWHPAVTVRVVFADSYPRLVSAESRVPVLTWWASDGMAGEWHCEEVR